MNVLMIAPLVIILGLIIGIVVLIMKVNRNKSMNPRKRTMSGQGVRWIFRGYLAVLLITTLLVLFTPMKPWSNYFKTFDSEQQTQEMNRLYQAASKGDIDSLNKHYLIKKWVFNAPSSQKLDFMVMPSNDQNLTQDPYLDSQVFIEKKDSTDNQIEAYYFQSGSSVNGKDITGLMKPVNIRLEKDKLIISNPKRVILKFATFQNSFTVTQFKGGSSMFNHQSSTSQGTSILYIRIPKNLNLGEQSNINLEIVDGA